MRVSCFCVCFCFCFCFFFTFSFVVHLYYVYNSIKLWEQFTGWLSVWVTDWVGVICFAFEILFIITITTHDDNWQNAKNCKFRTQGRQHNTIKMYCCCMWKKNWCERLISSGLVVMRSILMCCGLNLNGL